MGDFPVMTDYGTFIINGAERVIVSQLVRSPGCYYDKTFDKVGKENFDDLARLVNETYAEINNGRVDFTITHRTIAYEHIYLSNEERKKQILSNMENYSGKKIKE